MIAGAETNDPGVRLRFGRALAELPAKVRAETWLRAPWRPHQTVKDLAEAWGIPHPEIGAVIVDAHRSPFDNRPSPGARIEYLSYDDTPASSAPLPPPAPPGPRRFVADVHLAALARILRLAGFDTLHHHTDPGDRRLAWLAGSDRILLTRDVGLLKRREVHFGRWLRATRPDRQWQEVAMRYGLANRMRPFSRCTLCNFTPLRAVDLTRKHTAAVPLGAAHPTQCPRCNQVYWRGSHYRRIERLLELAKISPNLTRECRSGTRKWV